MNRQYRSMQEDLMKQIRDKEDEVLRQEEDISKKIPY